MTANRFFVQDPQEKLDYQFDFKPLTNGTEGGVSDCLASGETISSATVTADTGLTLESTSNTDDTVTTWASGGTAEETYTVTCHIVTSQGREIERSIEIQILDR